MIDDDIDQVTAESYLIKSVRSGPCLLRPLQSEDTCLLRTLFSETI
jgi:hypothetical protein